MEITNALTEKLQDEVKGNVLAKVAERAVTVNGIRRATMDKKVIAENPPVFSVDVKTGKVADQKATGRCWMFAALNTFRHKLLVKFQLNEFELSQTYTFFWDKYEKSNWFFEQIIQTAHLNREDRKVAFLLQMPQQDGGQWDMIVSIFDKYGVVPKSVYPEVAVSDNSRELNHYLNKFLRKGAATLREAISNGSIEEEVEKIRKDLLSDIYRYLCISLGTPPEKFTFEARDAQNDYHIDKDITPKEFYEKYIGLDLHDYVSVINAPTKDKPYHKSYTVEMLGNVVNGKEVKYLNVPMDELKDLARRQLESGESVWFGCDVGQASDKTTGVMAVDLYDLDSLYEMKFEMSKEDRLDYGESLMTHAMVLTGVDIIDGNTTKWKVENSWGEKLGDKGFFVASDEWMDEFTYQVVIRKDLLSKEQLEQYEQAPTLLNPWDPMGALA